MVDKSNGYVLSFNFSFVFFVFFVYSFLYIPWAEQIEGRGKYM